MRLGPLVIALIVLAAGAGMPARAADAPAGDDVIAQARSRFNAKQYREAIALLDPYLTSNPRDAHALVLRGDAKASLDDNNAALKDCNTAIAIAPEYQYPYPTRCETRLDLDDANGALSDCDTAIRLDPSDGRAYSDRGDVYYQNEAWAPALADYDKAVQLGQSSAYLFAARCDANRLNAKLNRASDDCAKALTLDPKNLRALWANGRLALVTARYQDSIANFNAYLARSGTSPAAYYWRGSAYNRIGSWKLALEDSNAYLTRKPEDGDGYREREFARAGGADAAGAIADFAEAARHYRRSGDLKAADQMGAFGKTVSAGNRCRPCRRRSAALDIGRHTAEATSLVVLGAAAVMSAGYLQRSIAYCAPVASVGMPTRTAKVPSVPTSRRGLLRTLLVAAVCAVALSGCGGGGGGGASPSPVGPTTPAPSPAPAPIQATAVQRADAGQALTSFNGTRQVAVYGGAGAAPLNSLRQALDAATARTTQGYRHGFRTVHGGAARAPRSVTYSACSNGIETAQVVVSPSEEQLYAKLFYDAACSKIAEDVFVDLVATSATAASASGTSTLYDMSGATYDYQTIALTISGAGTASGSFSIVADDAASASSPKSATLGVACVLAGGSSTCGLGAVARESVLSQDLGSTVGISSTTTVAGGNLVVPVSGSATSYTGALGALSLVQAAFPTFAVNGGSALDTGTFKGSFTYTPSGVLVAATFTLTDVSADGTVSVTSAGTPATSINGVITRTSTGQTLATFTVDPSGNGTITYSNGTTGRIVNWQIFG